MEKFYKIIIFFDLPSKTKTERKIYYKFRKFLLKSGYEMLQYSVYVRTCDSYERVKTLKKQLCQTLPSKGSIRLFVITQSQYEKMQILVGDSLPIDNSPKFEQLTLL